MRVLKEASKEILSTMSDGESWTVGELRESIEGLAYSQIVNSLHALIRRGNIIAVTRVKNGARDARYRLT